VFTDARGRGIRPWALRQRFKRPVRELPELPEGSHFHTLRHTAATTMLVNGTPAQVVCDQLGHANPAFTLRVYGHVIPAQQDASAEAAEAAYSGL